MTGTSVLVTWVAVNNDPFERDAADAIRLEDGAPVLGPTLTLLTDAASPYAGKVSDVVLFHQASGKGGADRVQRSVTELTAALHDRGLVVHPMPWAADDPTDHRGIFELLRKKVPEIRQRFAGRELVVHVSPGTPSMHTIWVLMAETGFIEPPFVIMKSYRRNERRGRPAVVPVALGIESFYKVYKASRPRQVGSEDQGVLWDPARFRTDAMKRVYAEARRFAQLNVPVLIRGERGTGKTTLATWIRSNSPFKREKQDDRWPSVACGQYTPETMRSELFGHRKGAFTGATEARDGLLAAAHQDTLFLDEVGDVSVELQRLLIKVIEDKRYYPIGHEEPKESDFRLVTATNIDDGELRKRLAPDFLDRISLLTLELPPLRAVPDELPWLWEVVYAEAMRRAAVPDHRATLEIAQHQRVVGALRQHPLPGNLRDLFRVAYRVLAARGDVDDPVTPADAVESGLEALEAPLGKSTTGSLARSVAGAFAAGTAIDDLLPDGAVVKTKELFAELQTFIAQELRRIAAERGVAGEDLCDVTDRSLRDWAKPH
ncbi:MAG: sigma-54-dependent Fis family transcriptional regulator [Myxococcales bacterium]|nr:sigma-54-dependent Fis family transcriptional regulator [Myxococcales bacterium]